MVPLPGTRGGRQLSHEPRGPGSLTVDRELTAFVRFTGMLGSTKRTVETLARAERH